MSGLEYPREWFLVDRWCKEPLALTMTKETATSLSWRDSYGRPRIEHKRTTYHEWFPTREAAQAAIDERERVKAQASADKRVRDAAPDLLSELEALVAAVCFADPPKMFNGVECHEARVPTAFIDSARAAIAKAKGGAA